MSEICLHITNANKNLLEQNPMITDAVKSAEKYTFSRLKIDWDIDMVVTNRMFEMIIPEDGVSGNTYTDDFIIMNIDEETVTREKLYEMTCHELCHAARWGKNEEWCNRLFDLLILEGSATFFEANAIKDSKDSTFFIKTITERSDECYEKILRQLRPKLMDASFDGRAILTQKTATLPRWSGYSLGYYFVKKYLKMTGKTIEEAFADKYEDFEIVL